MKSILSCEIYVKCVAVKTDLKLKEVMGWGRCQRFLRNGCSNRSAAGGVRFLYFVRQGCHIGWEGAPLKGLYLNGGRLF